MPQEEKDSSKRTVLKSVFLGGSVKRMKDLESLYPTYVAKLLGMNHSRYTTKLLKPESFTVKQIVVLAEHIDIDPQIIMGIIFHQLANDRKRRSSSK